MVVDPLRNWVRAVPSQAATTLLPQQLDLWLLPLDQPPLPLDELAAVLNTDEEARAARFHFPLDRRRFTSARGLLRHVVGAYVGIAPHRLRLQLAVAGKPSLVDADGIEFNLSHSGGWALLGIGRGVPLGVDLEVERDVNDLEQIARTNFGRAEVEALLRLPAQQRREAFFAIWTRKEAFIKALGEGLSMPLDRFEVSAETLVCGGPALLRAVDGSADAAATWSMWGLRPAEGLHVAAAMPATGVALRTWQWAPSMSHSP
jgi:4'-phosphopantetheinyl transferase